MVYRCQNYFVFTKCIPVYYGGSW